MHYLDKLHGPSLGAMGWVNFQSATPNKVGQNSTGVDTTALAIPREEAFSAQLVRWLCAASKAALLLEDGDSELRRLNRAWMAPVRVTAVFPITLPAHQQTPSERCRDRLDTARGGSRESTG
jgi:hypothetical protein